MLGQYSIDVQYPACFIITSARDRFGADFIKNGGQKNEREDFKDAITDSNFVALLEKTVVILEPNDVLIVEYKSDTVSLSDLLSNFHKLP